MTRFSRRRAFISALASVVLGALALAVPLSASAVGCPSNHALGNFELSPDGLIASRTGDPTVVYTFTSNDESSENAALGGLTGIPGLIEYCVYTQTPPDTGSVAASYDAWVPLSYGTGGFFGFKRPNGDPTNVPFDGSTQTMGSATFSSGVPSDQVILLHINDPDECNALYGGNPLTCFVLANSPQQEGGQAFISGVKYYDPNVDGVLENGDSGVAGFEITVQVLDGSGGNPVGSPLVEITDSGGAWGPVTLDTGTYYQVCEVLPTGTWQQTGPLNGATTTDGEAQATGGCWYGQANNPNRPQGTNDLDFGNVCLGNGNALTLGFWSNRNGQTLIASTSYTALTNYVDSLNLANATGPQVPFPASSAGYTLFKSWLLNATATNMAYMLSVQAATMNLNINLGGASGGGLIFAGAAPAVCTISRLSTNGYITASNLVGDASTEVGADPTTFAGDEPNRTCQGFKQVALNNANNNLNWVQAQACAVVYPPSP
jgi:hypothetical protein